MKHLYYIETTNDGFINTIKTKKEVKKYVNELFQKGMIIKVVRRID